MKLQKIHIFSFIYHLSREKLLNSSWQASSNQEMAIVNLERASKGAKCCTFCPNNE
jgi:hypothetical protein